VPFRTAFPLLAVLFATAFGAHAQAQAPTSLSTQTVVLNQLPVEAGGPLTLAAALIWPFGPTLTSP
jgi:ABC-type nitrate/sulfonate/bicarbonate transport system substrate-binding protein